MKCETEKFESIIIGIYYFKEGNFWVINVDGYIDDDSPDDPDNIGSDSESSEEDAIETAKFWRDYLLKDRSDRIVIHLEGSEYHG